MLASCPASSRLRCLSRQSPPPLPLPTSSGRPTGPIRRLTPPLRRRRVAASRRRARSSPPSRAGARARFASSVRRGRSISRSHRFAKPAEKGSDCAPASPSRATARRRRVTTRTAGRRSGGRGEEARRAPRGKAKLTRQLRDAAGKPRTSASHDGFESARRTIRVASPRKAARARPALPYIRACSASLGSRWLSAAACSHHRLCPPRAALLLARPAPDTSVTPPAGGKVPKARSLASAVTGKGPGDVRVVCQQELARCSRSRRFAKAEKKGFRLRPSQPDKQIQQEEGAPDAQDQPGAREEVRVPLGPGGGRTTPATTTAS